MDGNQFSFIWWVLTCMCCKSRRFSLTHWGRDKMATIFQTFSNGFLWMKMHELRSKLNWIMFLGAQLTIFQHCFIWWLGADQATSHYLNQWWPRLPRHICVAQPQWVKPQGKSRALYYYSGLTRSQSVQPMVAQLSTRAALSLARSLVTASCHSTNTGPM